jgi:hypothetical protein
VRHSRCFLHCSVADIKRHDRAASDQARLAAQGLERRDGFAAHVLTMLLLRWIAVAAVLLGIAPLAAGEETSASDLGADALGSQRTAGDTR